MSDKTPTDSADLTTELSANERREADVSALIDGELPPGRLLEVVDRLVEERHARSFYRHVRVLDALVEATETLPRTEAPPDVWQRIAESTEQPTDSLIPFERNRKTSANGSRVLAPLAAAAAVILALSLAVWMRQTAPLGTPPQLVAGEQLADITVGGREGQMTEDRFLALATEILEADQRYRREMVEIIYAVEASLPAESASTESSRYGEGRETTLLGNELDSIEDGRVDRNLNVRMW